jgi:isochorismate pyruvate lyase
MKNPEDCSTIDEIRNEIDSIDNQIVSLLGKRFLYVKAIVKFKKSEEDVIARERYSKVFEVRRRWAVEKGIDPDIVENIYKILIHYFIEEQRKRLSSR